MERPTWQGRVVAEGKIHHGEPCIAGTRIPVRIIVGSLADGLSFEEILAEYPQLQTADIQAALAYAAEVLHEESLLPLVGQGTGARQG